MKINSNNDYTNYKITIELNQKETHSFLFSKIWPEKIFNTEDIENNPKEEQASDHFLCLAWLLHLIDAYREVHKIRLNED